MNFKADLLRRVWDVVKQPIVTGDVISQMQLVMRDLESIIGREHPYEQMYVDMMSTILNCIHVKIAGHLNSMELSKFKVGMVAQV